MAIIKTDPGQAKTVAVLLIILVIAGVATVVRIHPATSQPAPTTDASVSEQVRPGSSPIAPVSQSLRNPFKKPDAIRAAFSKDGRTGSPPGTAASASQTSDGRSTGYSVDPASVGELPPALPSTLGSQPSPKQFELLATVRGPRGLCAVIRCEGTKTRIVGVGDMLDGYRVQKLESTRAYLKKPDEKRIANKPALRKKGSDDVIVVKKPRS